METAEPEGDTLGTGPGSQAGNDISIRCVTVRQLHEATQTPSALQFNIDGRGLKKIIIVANLCFLETGPTFTDFGLDDGTGRIKARQWRHNSDPPDETFDSGNFFYLRVIGDLEQFKGKKTIKVTDIRKVSSPYEPYYHILHAIRDTLVYKRGPPSSHGENQDPPGDTIAEESDILHHGGVITFPSLPSAVHLVPKTRTAQSDTYVDPIPQPANAKVDKGKAPVPTQPLSSTSVPSPILPTPYRRAEVLGIPEHSDVAYDDHDASISPGSRLLLGSSPSTMAQHHTRRFTPNDPYSKLTLLQRDVLLCIKTAAAHNHTPSVYPTPDFDGSEHNPTWKGVHVSVIIRSVTNRHPELDLGLPELMDCFEGLLEEGHICNPVDEEHYSCT